MFRSSCFCNLTPDELSQNIVKYAEEKKFNKEKVIKACEIAKKYHEGQKRKSGEPYIAHPFSAAYYLTQYYGDEESIIATILHDTVEDSEYTLAEVEKDFGKEIAKLIDGLTKFSKNRFRDAATLDSKIESMRKWFSVMQDDIRVAVIKLVDRLHNMQTLEGHSDPEKQKRIAKETLDIFVKIADKLGINNLREDLEMLCLKHLDPNSYEVLCNIQKKEKLLSDKALQSIKHSLETLEKSESIVDIESEAPAILKMHEQEIQLKEDLRGVLPLIFVVHAKSEEDCYRVLYLIHSLWKTERSGVRDYINNPDQNGYRGLHTTVIFDEGRYALFKIRTPEMEQYYQYGITLNCFSGTKNGQNILAWLKNLPLLTKDAQEDSEIFWNQLTNDVLKTSIVVHTDKDNSLLLPHESTALDAAFHSYGSEALKVQKIFINGVNSPFYKQLKVNDTIHFYFGKEVGVEYSWLSYVDTALTKSLIREGLKNTKEKQKIILGKNILEEALWKDGKGFIEEIDKKSLNNFCVAYEACDIDDIYKLIAEGEIETDKVINYFFPKKKQPKLVPPKFIHILGKADFVEKFFKKLPENIKNHISYSLSGDKHSSNMALKVSGLNAFDWANLQKLIARDDRIENFEIKDIGQRKYTWGLFVILSVLWGFDPMVAARILYDTAVTPVALTIMRFWSITLFLFLIVILENFFVKKLPKKNLSFLNVELLTIAGSIFCVAIFSYLTLQKTLASDYMISLGFAIGFFTMINIVKLSKIRLKFLIYFLILITGLIALYLQPFWPLENKLWMIGVVLFFIIYSKLSENYQKKEKIFIRYTDFLLKISLFAAIISMGLLFFVSWPQLGIKEYVLVFLFANIFITAPYYIYFHLMRKFQDVGFINYHILASLFMPIIAEIVFFDILPNILKIFALICVAIGVFFLGQIQKGLKTESH